MKIVFLGRGAAKFICTLNQLNHSLIELKDFLHIINVLSETGIMFYVIYAICKVMMSNNQDSIACGMFFNGSFLFKMVVACLTTSEGKHGTPNKKSSPNIVFGKWLTILGAISPCFHTLVVKQKSTNQTEFKTFIKLWLLLALLPD